MIFQLKWGFDTRAYKAYVIYVEQLVPMSFLLVQWKKS